MIETDRVVPDGPLADVRVIELGHAVSAPFAGAMLGDLGAEVIKLEPLERGDSLRVMGPRSGDVGLWWAVAGRNKKSIAIDLKNRAGVNILRDLARKADALIENYRPGVMDRLGVGWDALHELNPDLVMLSISGYGQTGPYRLKGGFGKIAEAFSGATNLTGNQGEPPIHPGYSIGDTLCGLTGAFGVLAAMHAREQGLTRGQHIDLAIYEPLFRIIEWQMPLLAKADLNSSRNGGEFPFAAAFVTTIAPTRDGDHVVISAATAATIDRLEAFVAPLDDQYRAAVAECPDQRTRLLTAAITGWAARTQTAEVLREMNDAGLIVGPVNTPAELAHDEQIEARNNIVTINDPRMGEVPMPGVVPRMSTTPGSVRWAGPDLGQHTDEVLTGLLGMDADRVRSLREQGVIR